MEWGDFLNSTAQSYITGAVAPQPAAPVAANPATGQVYQEGKPASGSGLMSNPLVWAGGAAVVLLVGFLIMRK